METLHLNIVDPVGEVITIDVFSQEPVFDIRNTLSEHPVSCYQTNYFFQKKDGTKLKEYQEIQEALGTEKEIVMKIDSYNKQALKLHIKRLREILLRTVPDQSNQQNEINENEKYLDAMVNKKTKKIECLLTFNYACFHPPPPYRRLQGDVGYLYIRTLENKTFFITAKTSGFFVNKSSIQSTNDTLVRNFDPEPQENESYFSKTLVELLKKLSPQFESQFKELCNAREDTLEGNSIRPNWQIKSPESNFGIMTEEEYGYDLFGYDITAMRDWNEEYQMGKALPAGNFMQKLQRDRTIHKIYSEFSEAAVKGAQAAVEGSLPTLNPSEDCYQQVYVFNNIFFSFVKDTPLSYKQEIGQDACATRTSNGHDFRSLKILQNLQIPGLSTILTAVVDYRGYRVVAQGLVPGLLSNEPDKATEYGSMDDGKSISWTPEFHNLMQEVSKQLFLKSSQFCDKDGKQFEIYGGIDIKGIQGTDKRRYVLEFIRHAPRDANYLGASYELCLLRPELVLAYNKHLLQKQIQALNLEKKVEEEQKKEEEKNEQPSISSTEQTSAETQTNSQQSQELTNQPQETNQEIVQKQVQSEGQQTGETQSQENQQQKIKNLHFVQKFFDVTQFSDIWTSVQNEEEKKACQEDILALSQFLVETQIIKVLRELEQDLSFYDSVSLGELMHENGVNIRYLGALLDVQQKENSKNTHIKNLIMRTALVRSARYIFNQYIRDTKDILLTQIIASLFNAILCPNAEKKSKKRKKKEKKNNEMIQESVKLGDISTCECLSTQELKYVFMREMCCTLGIQVKCSAQPFPLKAEHILQLVPIVRLAAPKSQEALNSLQASQQNPGNPDFLSQAIQTNTQTSGPLSQGNAMCYTQLGKIYFSLGDISQALFFQTRSLIILEKLFGNDHPCLIKEYQQLAYFFHTINDFIRSYEYMSRALWLHRCSIGEITPVLVTLLTNMAIIARDCEKYEESLDYITKAMEIGQDQDFELKKIYVKTLCMSGQKDKAVEIQTDMIQQLKQQHGNEDQKVVQAEVVLEMMQNPELLKNMIDQNKQNSKGRAIGQNKPLSNIGKQKNKQDYKVDEKQLLLKQKLHAKRSNAKMNVPNVYKANPHLDPEFRLYQQHVSALQTKMKQDQQPQQQKFLN